MSVIRYNGVTLPYSMTTNFFNEVVYDDFSGTDWICTKYDISVQCHIDLAYIGTIAPAYANSNVNNAAAIIESIRKDLLQPRRTLSFSFDGHEIIPASTASAAGADQLPGTVDVMHGPKPQSCTYIRLNNTHFILNYHIIAHYWENFSHESTLGAMTNRTGHVALYNKWTETVEIDKVMGSTRIRDGKYIIRSDNAFGYTADEIRSDLAVVGVPNGFVRESARYTVSPDGLGLSYNIVDKEQFKKFPAYVYDAEGTYTETAAKAGGAVSYGEVELTLRGAPNNTISPQNELVRIGILIVNRKLVLRGYDPDPTKKKGVLQHAQVRVDMYKNVVSFNWRVMLPTNNDRVNGEFPSLATAAAAAASAAAASIATGNLVFPVKSDIAKISAFTGDMCTTPLSDDNSDPQPRYYDRGTYGLVLQAAKYWDPDIPDTVLATDSFVDTSDTITSVDKVQHNHGVRPGRAGVERET